MFKCCDILQITYTLGLKTSRLLSKPQQICLLNWHARLTRSTATPPRSIFRTYCAGMSDPLKIRLSKKIDLTQAGAIAAQSTVVGFNFPEA